MSLVAYEPSSLAAIDEQCMSMEQWAEQCESVPELRDASNKLAAIDEYLNRTSKEGRSRVAAAMRRLEVRIGSLLGPASHGGDRRSVQVPHEELELPSNRVSEFRSIAQHPEVVEQVIAESTDEAPASRKKVLDRIRDAKAKHPVASPAPKSRAGIEARVAKAKQMAAEGYTSRQIAAAVGIANEGFPQFRARHGVEVPADAVVGKTMQLDSNRMVDTLVRQAAALDVGADLIDYGALDRDQIEGWVCSLESSIAFLRTVKNRLNKEQTQWQQ